MHILMFHYQLMDLVLLVLNKSQYAFYKLPTIIVGMVLGHPEVALVVFQLVHTEYYQPLVFILF